MMNRTLVFSIVCAFVVLDTASAHVTLDSPNGGEVVMPGDEIEIEWHVEIQHDTIAWDLGYSTDGGTTWKDIAIALAPGDITQGAIQSFPWTIPEEPSNEVQVRVKQDNTGRDYYDMSDENFAIVPEPGNQALILGAASLVLLSRCRRNRLTGSNPHNDSESSLPSGLLPVVD